VTLVRLAAQPLGGYSRRLRPCRGLAELEEIPAHCLLHPRFGVDDDVRALPEVIEKRLLLPLEFAVAHADRAIEGPARPVDELRRWNRSGCVIREELRDPDGLICLSVDDEDDLAEIIGPAALELPVIFRLYSMIDPDTEAHSGVGGAVAGGDAQIVLDVAPGVQDALGKCPGAARIGSSGSERLILGATVLAIEHLG
jgi:hypothetical protein